MKSYKAMNEKDFRKAVETLTARRDRFAPGAYFFVSAALGATAKRLGRSREKDVRRRHVTGRELAEGAADFAREQFGPLAYSVLREWGVRTTRDIGDVVFDLIALGLFSKTEEDSIQDFENVFDLRARLS
ncbi:MAG: Minf_1886 family protein [Candidatus Spyradosoma sp.]